MSQHKSMGAKGFLQGGLGSFGRRIAQGWRGRAEPGDGGQPDRPVTREEVVWGYRLILGREPESEAAIEAHLRIVGVEALRRSLLGSTEFGLTQGALLSRLPSLINFEDGWRESTECYYQAIERSGISVAEIVAAYAAADIANDPYGLRHQRRVRELLGYLKQRLGRPGCHLLEVGTSAHTTPFYSKFLDCRVDTICRPVASGGPTAAWAADAGSQRHWQVDLNHLEDQAALLGQIPQAHYDAVICCEVIEHLTKAPRDLIALLLPKLKPGGFIYLSTPNFLIPYSVGRLFAGSNPQPDFSRYQDNLDAHQHFREYTVAELLNEVRHANGVVEAVAFSNCWDHPDYSQPAEAMFRSNLVLIAAANPPEAES
jgi:SAM-dependent methyltransferase